MFGAKVAQVADGSFPRYRVKGVIGIAEEISEQRRSGDRVPGVARYFDGVGLVACGVMVIDEEGWYGVDDLAVGDAEVKHEKSARVGASDVAASGGREGIFALVGVENCYLLA